MTDTTILQVIFSALQLPWQCVGVSQQLLNNMDDYLLADEQVRDLSKITLSHIVSYFLNLKKWSFVLMIIFLNNFDELRNFTRFCHKQSK